MEPQAAFGANVRTLRRSAGLTQEQLGARCDMELSAISRIERGLKDVQLSSIVRLAHALDVTPARLLQDVP